MRINLDIPFFSDLRFRKLGKLLGVHEDIGRMAVIRVWLQCSINRSEYLPADKIDEIADIDGFAEALVKARLADAETPPNGHRVRGVSGRIQYLLEASRKGLRSAAKRREKYGSAVPIGASNSGSAETEQRFGFGSAETEALPLPLSLNTKTKRRESPAAPPNLLEIWNSERRSLRKAISINAKRQRTWASLWRETPDEEYWRSVIRRMAETPFCTGKNDRGWVAGINFLLTQDGHLKVLEGAYDAHNQRPARFKLDDLDDVSEEVSP